MTYVSFDQVSRSIGTQHRGNEAISNIGQFVADLLGDIRHRAYLRRRRAKFLRLTDYDDRMLDDMGLTRSAIARASNLPLDVNAAVEARRMTGAQR